MTTPAISIPLSDRAISDITDLILSGDHIEKVVDAAGCEAAATSISALSSHIAIHAGIPLRHVFDVLEGLWNIHRLKGSRTGAEIVDILTVSLGNDASEDWISENMPRWSALKGTIAQAIDSLHVDHPLLISQKADSVVFRQQNILISARILTDVRPIFNTAGDKILETVIVHSLSLHYATGSHQDHANITLSLDADDIVSLKKACERAEKKAVVAKDYLKDMNPIIIPEE